MNGLPTKKCMPMIDVVNENRDKQACKHALFDRSLNCSKDIFSRAVLEGVDILAADRHNQR